jgi:type IV pilus assembly protein PilQ
MNTGDLKQRMPRRLTAVALLALAAAVISIVGVMAATDDRPPILATQSVPEGEAAADQLISVQVQQQSGGYDVVLTGNGKLPYQVFSLERPTRIVFDLPGVTAATPRNRYEVEDEGLVRVRVGQFQDDPEKVARVVFELTDSLTWSAEQTANGARIRFESPTATTAAVSAAIQDTATQPDHQEPPAAATTTAQTEGNPEIKARPQPTPASYVPEATTARTTGSNNTAEPSTAVQAEIEKIAAEAAELTSKSVQTNYQAPPRVAPAQTEESATPLTSGAMLPKTETQTIEDGRRMFNGRPVTLNLVDADVKQVFGVFHDISGLNFVLDPAVGGSVTIVVDNVPWDQALDLILKNNSLDMVLEGNVVRIAPVAKLAQEAAARKALIEAKEFEAAPVSITRTLSYADVKDIEKVVRDAILSPKGRVVPDERTNTLIIRDIPSRIDAIDRLLTTLDAETPQVMIEARIVEVSRDFTRDLGVKWGFTGIADESKGTQTNLDFPYRGSVDWDLNLQRSTAHTLGFSFGNVLNSLTLDITLDALETEGYAKRLSSPKIATLNNEKAEIEQGVRIPIVSTTATEIDVTFVSASLRLMVTPQITAEGTVVLDLEVENNSADLVNVVGIPPINTQRAQTKVLIADGGTTVIGGIYSVNEGESENGVPWLRKIPGLGWLFKSKNVQQRNRELLIFVTPRIIKAS